MVQTRKVDHGTVTYLEKIELLQGNLLAAHSVWVNDTEVIFALDSIRSYFGCVSLISHKQKWQTQSRSQDKSMKLNLIRCKGAINRCLWSQFCLKAKAMPSLRWSLNTFLVFSHSFEAFNH